MIIKDLTLLAVPYAAYAGLRTFSKQIEIAKQFLKEKGF